MSRFALEPSARVKALAMLLACGGGFVDGENDDGKGRCDAIEYIPMTLAVDDDFSDGLNELRL